MNIDFTIDDSVNNLPVLYSDPAAIQQIFEILVDNSLKFTDEGGELIISAQIERKKVVFCVHDNGCGIPKKDIDNIFERFYKTKNKSNPDGNGIGLSIAKALTDELQEKIWAKSQYGSGTEIAYRAAFPASVTLFSFILNVYLTVTPDICYKSNVLLK